MSLEVKLNGPIYCKRPRCARKEPCSPTPCGRHPSFIQPGDTEQRLWCPGTAECHGLRLLHKIKERAFSTATEACPEPLCSTRWPWAPREREWSNTCSAAKLLCTARLSQRDGTRPMALKRFPGLQRSRLNQHPLREGSIGPSLGPGCSLLPTGSTWYQPLSRHDLINFIAIHSVEILHVLLVKISQYFCLVGYFLQL